MNAASGGRTSACCPLPRTMHNAGLEMDVHIDLAALTLSASQVVLG